MGRLETKREKTRDRNIVLPIICQTGMKTVRRQGGRRGDRETAYTRNQLLCKHAIRLGE